MNPLIFLSYSSKDKLIADAICSRLENQNIRCWIAPRDVMPGRSYSGEITRAIQQCKVLVLIFSGDSNSSQQVLREVQLAANSRLHIVQFRIDPAVPNDDLEYYLSGPHWLDALTPPLQNHLERLKASIQTLLVLPGDAAPKSSAKAAPLQPPQSFVPPAVQPAAVAPSSSHAWKWIAGAVAVLGLGYLAFYVATYPSRSGPEIAKAASIASPTESVSAEPARVPSPPSGSSGQPLKVSQTEAETFIKAFYRDIEKDDMNKVLSYFDDTVDYYAYGRREKAFIADQLRQYVAGFPVRSFSVGEINLPNPSLPDRATLIFSVRYSLRAVGQTAVSAGRSQVEWDLTKRQDSWKITRFAAVSYPDAGTP